ncbi:MAG: right-handed parallel beta-helix repeat-containing protein, partial [Thermomicrobiales bacterium]|nr:right-handed parallel beta-helix repeat-containing protein [Thermomicrobiales bacterium]
IQAAADAALDSATVRVCAGTYPGPVVIGRNLRLIGADALLTTIDGAESVRPLEIAEGKTVTISHLTVTRGSAPGGGGILNRGFLTMEDAHIIANVATGSDNGLGPGGGIRNAIGSTLFLTRCTISNNHASEGGAISGPFTGGISATLTVTDCLIKDNLGGGIGYGSNGTLTVRGCTIQGNGFTGPSCAGITSSGPSGTYAIEDSDIIGNDSPVAGGLELTGSGTITDCTISGNTAGFRGGGAAIEGPVTLTNCTILENSVVGNGGGLYLHGQATLQDCTITSNTANYHGGGIEALGGPIVLRNTQVTQNEAINGNGGGIYTTLAISLQDGSAVTLNTPDDCSGGGSC